MFVTDPDTKTHSSSTTPDTPVQPRGALPISGWGQFVTPSAWPLRGAAGRFKFDHLFRHFAGFAEGRRCAVLRQTASAEWRALSGESCMLTSDAER